jgi:hypothetical membrane protein
MNTNAISDLGTIPESSLLFNLTLVLTGVLTLVGGLLLHRTHERKLITVLFILAGMGAIGAGIFNLNSPGIHGLFALLAFVTFNLLAITCAGMVIQPLKTLSIMLGVVGLIFVVFMFLGDSGTLGSFGPIGHGGVERMIVYPVMIWMLGFGGYLLGKAQPRTAT